MFLAKPVLKKPRDSDENLNEMDKFKITVTKRIENSEDLFTFTCSIAATSYQDAEDRVNLIRVFRNWGSETANGVTTLVLPSIGCSTGEITIPYVRTGLPDFPIPKSNKPHFVNERSKKRRW